jgi:hypothetical protein
VSSRPMACVSLSLIFDCGIPSVFIGKLRGRVKVAVCEFRDELSESTCGCEAPFSPILADPCNIVDIRELKLLAEFKHPNIVRLVSDGNTFAMSWFANDFSL